MGKRPSEHPLLRNRIQRRIRNVRRRFYTPPIRFLLWLILKLPGPLRRGLFRCTLTPLAWLLHRRDVDRHLQIALPDRPVAERRVIRRQVIANLTNFAEECSLALRHGCRVALRNADDTEAAARVITIDQMSPAGWIGVTGHIGNWELFAAWLGSVGDRGPVHAVAKRHHNPHLNAVVHRMRERMGVITIYRDDPPRSLLEPLTRGCRVGMVPDQDVKDMAGVFLDFFGTPAYTPIGPARLALAAGVPLVPMALLRDRGTFRFHVGEPIWPDRTAPREAEILRLTRAWNGALEGLIRQYPGEWAWCHDRWRTRPEALDRLGRCRLSEPPGQCREN